ncbi:phospholipase D-like domain-containing protein [Burkholderia sp. Ac-20353]|uniref:phospholipase D-like domain-containing protein n=1 Tax=Burkholderia sp. Ac-20353 TaxID=2703894 RepID=UPI00197B7F80|nr:phospholipase [Burkholderia sp. Ac-20353]
MANYPLESHNPMDVAIDEAGQKANGTVQWLLEKGVDDDVVPTQGNALRFMICGQEGFAAIAEDLLAAKSTVDIVCWGFDPGMELVRSLGSACWVGTPQTAQPSQSGQSGVWPRGIVYGQLLEDLTTRKENPVTVRLLVWFDPDGSLKQNNMPGLTDVPVSGTWHPIQRYKLQQKPPYQNEARTKYCTEWWQRNLPGGKSGTGKNPRLQVVLRSISKGDVKALMDADIKEEDAPSTHSEGMEKVAGLNEKSLLEGYPTHHQKPILIDYAYEDGSKAVGYVMGLNSVTDYWDTTEHKIDDPLREEWISDNVQAELAHEQETQNPDGPLSTAVYQRTKPYQDYACRVVGPALKRLHQNFVRGWNLFAPPAWQATEISGQMSKIPTVKANPARKAQIVRTQAHEREKTIKKLYFQATSFARNYIYIENQYFFYPEFARHLKLERKKFHDEWAKLSNKPQQEAPMLHLFVVTPHPEDEGMIPRTHDTLAELGHGDKMPGQGVLVKDGRVDRVYKDAQGNNTFHPATLEELESTYGLKVSIARLRTSGMTANQQMAYREIYIHSKLMLIDDVFVTLGSANINQRSMAVDSEINIAATGEEAAKLRRDVFALMSGGDIVGSGARDAMPEVFRKWTGRMKDNRDIQKLGTDTLNGFLLPFIDMREKTVLHAMIDIPSTNSVSQTV